MRSKMAAIISAGLKKCFWKKT